MTLVLTNEEIQDALTVKDCLTVMEEAYLELAASRAVNRPTSHSYLPHPQPQSTYSFKSVDGGIAKFGVLALRITSDIVQEIHVARVPSVWRSFRWLADALSAWFSCLGSRPENCWLSCRTVSFSRPGLP